MKLTLLMLIKISSWRQRHGVTPRVPTYTHSSTDTNTYTQENTADVGLSVHGVCYMYDPHCSLILYDWNGVHRRQSAATADGGDPPLNPPNVKQEKSTVTGTKILFTTVCAIVIKAVADVWHSSRRWHTNYHIRTHTHTQSGGQLVCRYV